MNWLEILVNVAEAIPQVLRAAETVNQEVGTTHPVSQKAQVAADALTDLTAAIAKEFHDQHTAPDTAPGLERK